MMSGMRRYMLVAAIIADCLDKSGRFVRVNVGDRLDGGRVAAIGETTLQYVRSGRTVTLEIPG